MRSRVLRWQSAVVGFATVAFVMAALGAAPTASIGRSNRALRSVARSDVGWGRARWSVLPRSPLGPRFGATVIWDGTELLEIGGSRTQSHETPQRDGAAYDAAHARWAPLTDPPAVVAPLDAASVWTGRQLFMFGGQSVLGPEPACCFGALLDPATDRWTVSKAPVDQMPQPVAVWAGSRVVLAGVNPSSSFQLEAASFDPARGVWDRLDPPVPSGHPPVDIAMVATPGSVVLWSLWSRTERTGPGSSAGLSGVDVFRLGRAGGWTNVTRSWPQHQTVDAPIFNGHSIVLSPGQIWCGTCSHPPPLDGHGYVVNPATLNLTAIAHGPLDDLDPQVVWAGGVALSLNDSGQTSGPGQPVLPGDIAIWNPVTRRWTRGPRAPRDPVGTPVWDGSHLLTLTRSGHLIAFGG